MRPSLRTTLKLCVTAAVVYYLFVSLGETVTELPKALASVGWKALVVALALNVIGTVVLPSLATHVVVARQGIHLPWTELLRINFVTRFYAVSLPRGAALAVRWDRYRRAGSATDAVALVVFERLANTSIYLLLGILCLSFEFTKLPGSGRVILAVLILALAVPTAMLLPFAFPSTAKRSAQAVERLRPRLWPFLVNGIERLMHAAKAYRSLSRRDILLIVGFTTLGYVCFVSSAYAISIGMGLELGALALGWIRSVVFTITQIPISIAGIGVRELGFVELLALYDTPRAEALAFAVLLFFIQLSIGGVGGLLELSHALGHGKRKLSDLRR